MGGLAPATKKPSQQQQQQQQQQQECLQVDPTEEESELLH
jgi:hypothetical protein